MSRSMMKYIKAVYEANTALTHSDNLFEILRVATKLRAVAPDHLMLPALDAKAARLKTIANLLEFAHVADDQNKV